MVWVEVLVIPVLLLSAGLLLAMRHDRRWSVPACKLLESVPQVREGLAPIEQLSEVTGPLEPVVKLVQDLLHQIRRNEVSIAELNEEVRRRIANRTDALERQIGSLRQQAARDGLTGLYNRRMLEQFVPRLIERCRNEKLDLAVLMIDIDFFKQLNDTLGHAAGDELLRDVARIIQSGIGHKDIAVRYGGDEFVVLMPGADSTAAQATANRLSSLVEGLTRTLRVSTAPRLSIGMAQLSQLGAATPQDLLLAADRSLYDAKAARRNASRPASLCA